MGFRTLEISHEAEIHIKDKQLEVTTAEGVVSIPLEDLNQILVHGANIRLSTMDLSILSQSKISLITLDHKYLPTAMVLPFNGNSRQSQLMHAQIKVESEKYEELWVKLIKQKINNQSRALSIMGKSGAEKIAEYGNLVDENNVNAIESLAAKEYFSYYHAGLNRRSDDPINSRLNYGYAIVRGAIARKLISTGFHPTFGIHHNSQLNPFNLVDDLIEPYRAIVDLVANDNMGSNVKLTKLERRNLSQVLYCACIVDGVKVNVMSAIDMMIESLKRIILKKSDENLKLPMIIPLENMESITE